MPLLLPLWGGGFFQSLALRALKKVTWLENLVAIVRRRRQ